ncbi:hypothetical protein AALT_g3804 [Alternaria alternata]|nr:hypothetical protein AALT_g3804 [Alternaria alternata]
MGPLRRRQLKATNADLPFGSVKLKAQHSNNYWPYIKTLDYQYNQSSTYIGAFYQPPANMYQNLGRTPNWETCFKQTQLTEENLRTHTATHKKLDSACEMDDQLYYRYDGDFAESDDGNVESQRETIALRRAASLEVLKAYGGCFASGFLALQEPLPSRPKSKLRSYESAYSVDMSRTASNATSLETASSSWSSNVDVPRPDSSTLGAPVPESKSGKWSWRSMRRSRKQVAKKIEV